MSEFTEEPLAVPKPEPSSSSLHADDLQPAPGVPAGALTELQILLAAGTPREGLLIARRDSELLQEGLPAWARGMLPAKTLGPFVDAEGKHVLFDVFAAAPAVLVFRAGLGLAMKLPAGTHLVEGQATLEL